MNLSKDEKNLEIVLDALKSKVQLERARAINRLNHLNLWTETKDIETITNALSVAHDKETIKTGKKKIKKILDKYTIHLNRTEEERAEVIRKIKKENDIKIKKEKERIEAQKRKKELEERARIEAIELRKEQAKKSEEEAIFHRNRIIKEQMEYDESLRKDKAENPHLALISDHLWWLALAVKVGFVLMILQFIFFLMLFG